MSDSSKDESEVQISLSARKRRSSTRSRITSDFDSEERKEVKEHSESSLAVETKENDDGDNNVHGNSHLNPKTPRTSERLRRKRTRSFTFPSREKRLESVSGGRKMTSSQTEINALRPRKLVNNFLKEHTTYVNHDESGDSDDRGMSDFVADDGSSNDSAESMSENDDTEASNKDYVLTSDPNKPGMESIEGSGSGQNDNFKHSSDSSLSSRKSKSTSSDEDIKKRVKRRKRRKVIQSSDSDEGKEILEEKLK